MYKYATKINEENTSKASGISLSISTKISVEICSFIRGKNLQKAKNILENVIAGKQAVPYKRYNQEIPHRKGKMASGRFPKKASNAILRLLKSVEANAQLKGLNTNNLAIKHLCAHQASRPMHVGRHRNRVMKRTHVEIVVEETKEQPKKEEIKKDETKDKPEAKKEVNQEPKKEEEIVEKKKTKDKKSERKEEVKKERDENKSEKK